jgi:hypothetical protein
MQNREVLPVEDRELTETSPAMSGENGRPLTNLAWRCWCVVSRTEHEYRAAGPGCVVVPRRDVGAWLLKATWRVQDSVPPYRTIRRFLGLVMGIPILPTMPAPRAR